MAAKYESDIFSYGFPTWVHVKLGLLLIERGVNLDLMVVNSIKY